MAHEIGHVLGFHHPDAFSGMNLRATSPMGNGTCLAPLKHVELSPQLSHADGAESIMYSMTRHRDRTCLTQDDLEGLNFLYPLCEGVVGTPQCIKMQRHSGWLRLGIATAVPFLMSSLLILLVQLFTRRYQQKKVESLEATAVRLRQQRKELLGRLKRQYTSRQNVDGRPTTPGRRLSRMVTTLRRNVSWRDRDAASPLTPGSSTQHASGRGWDAEDGAMAAAPAARGGVAAAGSAREGQQARPSGIEVDLPMQDRASDRSSSFDRASRRSSPLNSGGGMVWPSLFGRPRSARQPKQSTRSSPPPVLRGRPDGAPPGQSSSTRGQEVATVDAGGGTSTAAKADWAEDTLST